MSKDTCGAERQDLINTQLDLFKSQITARVENVFSSRPTWSAAGWDMNTLQDIERVVDQEVNKLKQQIIYENNN